MGNTQFVTLYKEKEKELGKLLERNDRIRYIHKELGITNDPVIDDVMDDYEKPEKALVVEDHEVTVERVLNEEQQRIKDEKERVEEEMRRLAAGDNKRERG